MSKESEIQNLKNKYPDFFGRFSPEFLDFVFSEEISAAIAGICQENGIEDEEIVEKITSRIILALFDQVPKENLAKILGKGANLNPVIAEKIAFDVEEHIFSQIPEDRDQPAKSSLAEPETAPPPETPTETEQKKKGSDAYREPIE